ncbi:uncharacterized protein [Argopecten irradians]|uniref:uncharacterized protein n=1 Tax=Argopecten irradians TaxID=31199 RepID=UPI003721231B
MLPTMGPIQFGCVVLLVCCLGQPGVAYYFEKGFDHFYTYSSRSDLFGMHHFTTIMKFRIRPVNHSSENVHSLMLDSFVQHSEDGYIAENPHQWDLSKRFYFRLNDDGTVAMVHYDHADDEEVIALKKVLTSTLSAKANIHRTHPREFSNREVDHAGDLEHQYSVTRGPQGMVLRRSHNSSADVHRNHNKTMHYNSLGTVKYVMADDTIRLRQSKSSNVSTNAVNAEPIQDWSSGDFPQISSNAVSKLQLTKKRLHAVEFNSDPNLVTLANDSIQIKSKVNKTTLQQISEEMETALKCIRANPDKHSANRTACVRQLRTIVFGLHDEDYETLVTQALAVVCDVNNTVCADQRSLFIDFVGGKGDEFSQRLLLQYLTLSEEEFNEKEAFRILVHLINLESPLPELVMKIEHICFGKDNEFHGSEILTKTQRRACLTLGSLAKAIRKTDPERSDTIISKLEAWLGLHNETKSAPILKQRRKRSVTEVDRPRMNHIVTKLVFINSLGNSGMERSLDHILSYLQPNQGTSSWRRAAVLGLRQFKCNKSANALLHTALYDDHDLVKELSLKAFTHHPRGKTLLPEHYDMVLTKNYSYPALVRLKRGLIDIDTTGGFRMAITIPGINWDKQIGSSDVGASFGLTIRNRMELELKPLQGHFLIDSYNTAFIKAYCGMLNIKVDVFNALACYQGHIGYDLNVLKDFGINGVKELVNIFDTIMKNTVDPIKKAVHDFKTMVQTFRDGGIQKMFNSLVSAVKNLPQVIKAAADKFVALMKKVADFGGLPWLDDIKRVVVRVKTFIEDVRDDIMGFYNTVVDAVTITLPYIGKQLMDSIVTIISSVKSVLSNPSQAMSGMTKALMNIKMAISMFLDVKNQVLDACFFLKGKTPYWMTIGEEVAGIISDVHDFLARLAKPGPDGIVGSTIEHVSMTVSDGIEHMEEQAGEIKAELIQDFKEAMGPLNDLYELAKPVIDTFNSVMDVVQGIKSTYEFLRDMIIKAKSMIQKIFGPKFNIKFPTRRREEDAKCGQGVWPTDSAGLYKTTGVNVILNRRSRVPCPVNGMVYKRSSTQLLIIPTDADFQSFEIVLDNVEPDKIVSAHGTYVDAGIKIGRADKSPCMPNYIHLAMRVRITGPPRPDEDYNYVDPSPYLDRLMPMPQWIEECNELSLIIMDQVIEAGALDEEGADEETEEVDSSINDNDINNMDPAKEPAYKPDFNPDSSQNVGSGFLSGMKDSLSSFSDLKNMFSGDNMKVPNILDIIDLKKYSVSKVTDILSPALATDFNNVIHKLSGAMNTMPSLPAGSLSIPQLRNVLGGAAKGLGDKYSMINKLFSMTESICPTFRDGLNKGMGHLCQVHADCLGLSCELMLPYGSVMKMVSVDISVRPCDWKLQINVNSADHGIGLDGHDHSIHLLTIAGLSADLIFNGDVINNEVILSAEVTLCHEEFLSCLVRLKITTDIKFPRVDNCDGSGISIPNLGSGIHLPNISLPNLGSGIHLPHLGSGFGGISLPEIGKMSLGDMILSISQNDVMDSHDMHLIGKIRDSVVSELFKNPKGLLKILGKEFQDKMDFCIDVDIPIDPFEITFFNLQSLFMVGPVPLTLGFGAGGSLTVDVSLGVCFLSMKARVTVTPGVGATVWGTAAINLGFAKGGIKLIGYLLQTSFPTTGSIGFSKFPLDVAAKMDLVLVPLKLDLRGFAEIFLLFKTVTVFDKSIWSYTTPTIKKNIFTTPMKGEDSSPPEFPPNTVGSRKRREGPRGCLLEQVQNRSPLDAAFKLEVSTLDETSQVTLLYAIGTQHGGTNVVDWTEMGGASLLVPTNDLPSGIPLYFTVKARNTQGLEAFSYCMLPTYDTTIPDGRVDPSYKFSSHPNKISGTVVVFDDSTLIPSHEKALGFSSGQYGSEFIPWDSLDIDKTTARDGVNDELKYFGVPRDGKLTAPNFKSAKARSAVDCAKLCLEYSIKCVSFDYEYHSEICDLHEVVEGPRASLRLSGTYKSYERLGVGHSSYVLYENLDLAHATAYYINAKVNNVLGYTAYLSSVGTTVDFTPPFTGPLGPDAKVTMHASGCSAALTQRCVEVTWNENHRMVIDDEESRTVFNGHKPLEDEKYTINNHLASVNFDGFHDDESDIWGYTWMVGKSMCTQDVVGEADPHQHHSSKKYWTNSGYQKDLHLQDGKYYTTVRALNSIVFGGALVTTVCHSTPFTVDTTPPIFTKVLEIFYDEDFDLLAVYFNASDPLSKLARVDFGLGKTKHDVTIRGYELQTYITRGEPYVAIEHLGLGHGIPAWLRLRAVNNVGLNTARHGDEQILIDLTPPSVGVVHDGDKLDTDIDYQWDTSTICAEWVKFYDEESGIKDFIWGVGTSPGKDNIVTFHNLTHHFKRSCVEDLALIHNTTYYSTVKAYNAAINSKGNSTTSDGVLIDTTHPLPGVVFDGSNIGSDIGFSSERATKSCNWDNFTDPESHISKYDVSLFINSKHIQTFEVDDLTQFTERSIAMNHRDEVEFVVTAENGAGLTVEVTSDGFIVDHTTPIMHYLHDTETGHRYQSFNDHLDVSWLFEDDDSGIKEYRYFINRQHQGSKHKAWPKSAPYMTTDPDLNDGPVKMEIDQLNLVDGAKYSLVVTAINHALLSTSHESFGVVIDGTAPLLTKVHIGLPMKDEELDDLNRVLHTDPNILTLSWVGQDPESGISKVWVGVGTSPGDLSTTGNFIEYRGDEITMTVSNLELETFTESNSEYYVSVKVTNGAGLESDVVSSKPIVVLKANVPGQISDGREEYVDDDYTIDRASLDVTFAGFESEACDIRKYEWAIGSDAYKSDVLPYTGYGLMVHNSSHGQAQIHMDFTEGDTYYVTVRALPGHNCNEEYIVSTSDGIKLDTSAPEINYIGPEVDDTHYIHYGDVFYQSNTDSLNLVWNVSDDSAVNTMSISAGSLPFLTDVKDTELIETMKTPADFLSPESGIATFLALELEDSAGNVKIKNTDPVIADISPPMVRSLKCTEAISVKRSMVACSWEFVVEEESVVKSLTVNFFSPNNKVPIRRDIPHGRRKTSVDVAEFLVETAIKEVSVQLTISNVLHQNTTYVRVVTVDRTPPSSASVKVVTKMSREEITVHQRCQIPQTYVEVLVENVADEETEIEKVEVALGSKPGHTDISRYKDISPTGKIFFGNLDIGHGDMFYATARVTNKGGLSKMFYSDSVTVSVRPMLTVGDGGSEVDEDYQSSLNTIRGFWRFSDTCPIEMVQWKIEDLLGNVIKDFEDVVENAHTFYSDEFSLKNGFTYINIIRVRDALNRTFTSASDGVTVRIQPPNPGDVRDGLEEDISYQQSVVELSANWDTFGDDTGSPTQTVRYYEVALGDNNRYEKTRSNIHYYVNVGLNTSYTFRNLNLTAQSVTYYVTVRATSMAGSQEKSTSNGVKAGFKDLIVLGSIETPDVQSDVSKIIASWTDFQSDIGIRQYLVGVSSNSSAFNLSNSDNNTSACDTMYRSFEQFDEKPMSSYGLDTLAEIQDLHLVHGHSYYVTVVAENEADMCQSVTSSAILVDTTPPDFTAIELQIGNVIDDRNDDLFVADFDKLDVSWRNFTESESSIASFEVTLYQMTSCDLKTVADEFKVDSILVTGDTKATMYRLSLLPNTFYFVHLTALNTAGLSSSVSSSRFRVDTSGPLNGDVKITPDWSSISTFQSSKDTITSWIAIARTQEDFLCPNQRTTFPAHNSSGVSWEKMATPYSPEFVDFTETKATLTIGYNTAQTKFIKSGMESTEFSLIPGNYTVSLKAARGDNIVSIISFGSESQLFPTNYTPPYRTTIDEVSFNMTIPEQSDDESNSSTTQQPTTPTTQTPSTFGTTTVKGRNFTDTEYGELPNPQQFGFGLSIMGTQQNGSDIWDAMFWVVGKYKNVEEWITLDANPYESREIVTFALVSESSRDELKYNIKLYINGVIKAIANGIDFGQSLKTFVNTINDNDNEPGIQDVFDPFRSEVVITHILIPTDIRKPCLQGTGFYDGESSIKEIWVGVTDNENSTDSVSAMRLYQTMCLPCEQDCLDHCPETCLPGDFDLMKIEIGDLDLLPTIASPGNGSEYEYEITDTHTYYVNIKAVNFAGQESVSRSNGIMVDTTPAICEYVRCLDPLNSMDEPTEYIGSNNTVAAYWSCIDPESEVYSYSIGIGTSENDTDLYNMTDVGLATNGQIYLDDDKFFIHGDAYYFNVWAYNAAGTTGRFSCKFNVELYPPDVKHVASKSLFEYDATDGNGNPIKDVSFTEVEDSFGVAWNSKNDIADVYEWSIGTTENTSDILPMIKAGISKTGQAEIIHGHFWFNGTNMNSTVSKFRDHPNNTHGGSTFLLEPGRCLHHSLVAVGRSHLRSAIPMKPTCITRRKDFRLMLNESEEITLMMASDGTIKKLEQTSTSTDNANVIIEIKARRSGIMIGSLSTVDVTKNYGTDASDEFSPSIVDPKTTMMYTSRLLTNRLQDYQGLSFFISPMPVIESSELEMKISVRINAADYNDDTVPALAVWDNPTTEDGKWLHVQEECDPESINKLNNGTYLITKVCHKTLVGKGKDDVTRQKRAAAADTALTSPFQFGLFTMRSTCFNTPPNITTDVIHTAEDTTIIHQLTWSDAENDPVTFSSKQPLAGQLTVTADGLLTFIPPQEFSGQIYIEIEAQGTSPCSNSHPVSKVITVHVTEVDDPPVVGFLSHNDNFTLADHLDAEIVIFLEGNNTKHHIGSLLMVDADVGESLTFVSREMHPTGARLVQEDSADPIVPNNTFTPSQSASYKRTDLRIKTETDFHGHLHYKMIGSDRGGQRTARIDLHVFVLISPCNYGRCTQADNGNSPCNDSARADSYDMYTCTCNSGYHKQWCDEEINECADDPCPPLYDCTDHIAFFTCKINAGKLTAIILCSSIVVAGLCIFIVYRYKKLKKYTVRVDSTWSLEDELWNQGSTSQLNPGMASAKSIFLGSNLLSKTGTDNPIDVQDEDPPPAKVQMDSEPIPRMLQEHDVEPLNLLDSPILAPGIMRNPVEMKGYQSLFKRQQSSGNVVKMSNKQLAEVDV